MAVRASACCPALLVCGLAPLVLVLEGGLDGIAGLQNARSGFG